MLSAFSLIFLIVDAVAQAWVNANPTHGQYVDMWSKAHPDLVAKWIKDNPATPQPKAADLAVLFFENFSNDHPGMFPSAMTQTGADGKSQTSIQRAESRSGALQQVRRSKIGQVIPCRPAGSRGERDPAVAPSLSSGAFDFS